MNQFVVIQEPERSTPQR